MHNTLDFS